MPKYIVDVDLWIGETYTIEAEDEDDAEREARRIFANEYSIGNAAMIYATSDSYEETDDEGKD